MNRGIFLVGVIWAAFQDRKSTRLNSSHGYISYAVFCLKKKNIHDEPPQPSPPPEPLLVTHPRASASIRHEKAPADRPLAAFTPLVHQVHDAPYVSLDRA